MIADAVSIKRNNSVDVQCVRLFDHLMRNSLRIPDNVRIIEQMCGMDQGDVLRFDFEHSACFPEFIASKVSFLLKVS